MKEDHDIVKDLIHPYYFSSYSEWYQEIILNTAALRYQFLQGHPGSKVLVRGKPSYEYLRWLEMKLLGETKDETV